MNESETGITKPLAYQVSSKSEMVMWKRLLKWLGMTHSPVHWLINSSLTNVGIIVGISMNVNKNMVA